MGLGFIIPSPDWKEYTHLKGQIFILVEPEHKASSGRPVDFRPKPCRFQAEAL